MILGSSRTNDTQSAGGAGALQCATYPRGRHDTYPPLCERKRCKGNEGDNDAFVDDSLRE
jgi:hypothetical protein